METMMYAMSPEVYYREYDKQVAAALLRQTGKTEAQPAERGHVPWPKVRSWLSALRARVELRNHPAA
jgi:hypothetical protein